MLRMYHVIYDSGVLSSQHSIFTLWLCFMKGSNGRAALEALSGLPF